MAQYIDGKWVNNFADDILLNTKIREAYTNGTLREMVGMMHYKGTVDTADDLPTTGNNTGDVYNVSDTGKNYAWDGTSWDELSGIMTVDTATTETAGIVKISDSTTGDSSTSALVRLNSDSQLVVPRATTSAYGAVKLATSTTITSGGALGFNSAGQAYIPQASSSSFGAVKLGTDDEVSGGAAVGKNSSNQLSVPVATESAAGAVTLTTSIDDEGSAAVLSAAALKTVLADYALGADYATLAALNEHIEDETNPHNTTYGRVIRAMPAYQALSTSWTGGQVTVSGSWIESIYPEYRDWSYTGTQTGAELSVFVGTNTANKEVVALYSYLDSTRYGIDVSPDGVEIVGTPLTVMDATSDDHAVNLGQLNSAISALDESITVISTTVASNSTAVTESAENIATLEATVTTLETTAGNISAAVESLSTAVENLSTTETSGLTNNATGTDSIALGTDSEASSNYSAAYGYGSIAEGDYSSALGNEIFCTEPTTAKIGVRLDPETLDGDSVVCGVRAYGGNPYFFVGIQRHRTYRNSDNTILYPNIESGYCIPVSSLASLFPNAYEIDCNGTVTITSTEDATE